MLISNVVQYLNKSYPIELASESDLNRIGFIIGDQSQKLKKALLALDLNLEVLKEAQKEKANLIITHHPFIFNPLYKILFDKPKGAIIQQLCIDNISLYVAHTNLDVGTDGVNDVLSRRLQLKDIKVINDEIARDNFMRYGKIEAMSLRDFARQVKKLFEIDGVRIVGEGRDKIKTVGIIGGAGSKFEYIQQAIDLKLDCYITGEIPLHIAQYAKEEGLNLIEVPHGIERLVLPVLKDKLENNLGLGNQIIVSKVNTDPLLYL